MSESDPGSKKKRTGVRLGPGLVRELCGPDWPEP